MAQARSAMTVTTVRFGEDPWRLLEGEAALAGVSVSQYIREAALARAAAAALLQRAAETGRNNGATSAQADRAVRRSPEVRKDVQLRRHQRAPDS